MGEDWEHGYNTVPHAAMDITFAFLNAIKVVVEGGILALFWYLKCTVIAHKQSNQLGTHNIHCIPEYQCYIVVQTCGVVPIETGRFITWIAKFISIFIHWENLVGEHIHQNYAKQIP